MSNFDMLSLPVINATLRSFRTQNLSVLTPIRFEAMTPDEFALLFRADLDGSEAFFVLYQSDYMTSPLSIGSIIEEWYGQKPERFIEPAEGAHISLDAFSYVKTPTPELNGLLSILTKQGYYFSALAVVPRPPATKYWGNVRRVRPGQDLDKSLAHIPAELRVGLVKQILEQVIGQVADPAEQELIRARSAAYDGNAPCALPGNLVVGVTYEPASRQTDIVFDMAPAS